MLLAFDQTSLVYLWDLDTLELKGSIDSTDTLESIVSMNTDKDYFIAGGSNSTVAIWNIYTRQLVKVLPKEIIKSEARNVGICGNTIVFAVCDGTFHVHDFDTLQERFVLNILDAAKLSVPFVAEIFGQESVESVENDQVAEESDGEFTLENAIENGGFTPFFTEQEFVPTVLSLNSHVLLTNGCGNGNLEESSDVLLWDLKTGKLICSLSENIAMEKYSLVARDADPIRVAEITKDGTMIYSSVDQIQDCCRLLVWDFCSIERNVVANRASLCAVGSVMPIQVWVVSPEL
jgi:WD40 repeat protein